MIDIFYKSYSKDFKLLNYSLQSITKNVTGYNNIVILIPEKDRHSFDTRILPKRTLVHYIPEPSKTPLEGYLFQQVCKLKAHNYSSADYILFSDSDVIFDRKIDLNDYITEGKPEILYTDWSKVGQAICWKQPTETIMAEPVLWEFMRRNCLVYHRSTLVNINEWQPNLEYIVMQSERFSEFNLIGAYAFKNEPEKYNFINTDNWEYTDPKGIQLWSWAEKNNNQIEHLVEYERSLKVINEVLNLNLTEL